MSVHQFGFKIKNDNSFLYFFKHSMSRVLGMGIYGVWVTSVTSNDITCNIILNSMFFSGWNNQIQPSTLLESIFIQWKSNKQL